MELGESPKRSGKVRNNIFWYQYKNGTINIAGSKYLYYTIKDAVSLWRKQNPKY